MLHRPPTNELPHHRIAAKTVGVVNILVSGEAREDRLPQEAREVVPPIPAGARVTEPGFSSPNQPIQERTTAYRDSSGPDSRSEAHCATIVGDWEEASGESRFKAFGNPLRFRQVRKCSRESERLGV